MKETKKVTKMSKWEEFIINRRINRSLKTEKQKERESIYLSLISLAISITVLIIKLFFK